MKQVDTTYGPEVDTLVARQAVFISRHINTPHRHNAEVRMLKQVVAQIQQSPRFKRANV
jgi:hypothetical protein